MQDEEILHSNINVFFFCLELSVAEDEHLKGEHDSEIKQG